jgi:hypothetical protein
MARALGLGGDALLGAQLKGNPLGYGVFEDWGALAPLVSTQPGDGLPEENCAFVILATGPARSALPQDGQTGNLGINNANDPAPPALQDGATINDLQQLVLTLLVPANVHGFAFDLLLLSAEYPEYVCSEYKDTFYVLVEWEPQLDGGSLTNVAWDPDGDELTINSAAIQQAPYWSVDIAQTGYEVPDPNAACTPTPTPGCTPPDPCPQYIGSTTGWLRTQVPATPGETIIVTFSIHDEGDGILDTAAVLDNFQWLPTPVTAPTTTQLL